MFLESKIANFLGLAKARPQYFKAFFMLNLGFLKIKFVQLLGLANARPRKILILVFGERGTPKNKVKNHEKVLRKCIFLKAFSGKNC